MQKVGEYWVPDVDMHWFRSRRKTLDNYQNGGHGTQIGHLQQAIDQMVGLCGAQALARSVAVDAGANVGAYARRLSQHFASVHALEPADDTHACLARNIADWGLEARIHAHHKAISDQPGRVGMKPLGLFRRSISREVGGDGQIEAVTLDGLGLSEVLLIKLDVEGHEFKALSGATDLLARCRPFVMMELKARKIAKGTADLRAQQLLLDQGYERIADLGEPVIDRLYAPKERL